MAPRVFDYPASYDPDIHGDPYVGTAHGLGHASWGYAHRCADIHRPAHRNRDAGVAKRRSNDKYTLAAHCVPSADAHVVSGQSVSGVRGLYARWRGF